MRTRGDGARSKLRKFLEAMPPGTKFTAQDAHHVAGIQEFARRLRELRAEEGFMIHSYREDTALRADEYIYHGMGDPEQTVNPELIANRQRLRVQKWCELCGREEGDPHPTQPNRKVRLVVRNRYDNAVVCSHCSEGLSDISGIPAFGGVEILKAQIKRLTLRDRRTLAEWLARWAVDDLTEVGPQQGFFLKV